MKTRLVRIGNSQGIRLPKPLIEQTKLTDDVELVVRAGELIVRPARPARAGWADAFSEMARRGDDALLLESSANLTDWDSEDWQWE